MTLIGLAVTFGLLPIPTFASTPQDVTISGHKIGGDLNPGVFIAVGGITDSGRLQQHDFHNTALPAPNIGTDHFITTLYGNNGTIDIHVNGLFTFAADTINEDGNWRIVGGTRAYASLLGQGDYTKVINLKLSRDNPYFVTITFRGQVH
jgi:hypothetical protein